jgi:hypothetical protein
MPMMIGMINFRRGVPTMKKNLKKKKRSSDNKDTTKQLMRANWLYCYINESSQCQCRYTGCTAQCQC